MLLREGVVGERLLNRAFHKLGRRRKSQTAQLLDHADGLLPGRREVLAGVDYFEHRGNLAHLGRGHVAEDIAVPMHDAALPRRLGEELSGAFGKPHAGVGDDQPDPMKAAALEMLEEPAPAGLVFFGAFADAKNLPITLAVHRDRHQ
jgi:hypothetical protein